MKKLVLSQTCQGAILRDLLLSSPELAEAYQCLFVPNYALEADAAKPAAVDTLVAELPNCDVLIYHDIAAFDFPARLAQLPPGALAIKVPYVTSTIYWPSHDYRHPCRLAPRGTTALIPWPCRVLNDLIVRLRDEDAIVRAYLDTDLTAGLDLSRHLADQLDYLHKSQVGTPFALAECVERDFATQRLFHMINHPAMQLHINLLSSGRFWFDRIGVADTVLTLTILEAQAQAYSLSPLRRFSSARLLLREAPRTDEGSPPSPPPRHLVRQNILLQTTSEPSQVSYAPPQRVGEDPVLAKTKSPGPRWLSEATVPGHTACLLQNASVLGVTGVVWQQSRGLLEESINPSPLGPQRLRENLLHRLRFMQVPDTADPYGFLSFCLSTKAHWHSSPRGRMPMGLGENQHAAKGTLLSGGHA